MPDRLRLRLLLHDLRLLLPLPLSTGVNLAPNRVHRTTIKVGGRAEANGLTWTGFPLDQ